MLKQNTVADSAVFCSLLVLAGILMGVFGHQTWVNSTRRNRRQWEKDMARNPYHDAKVTFHTDKIPPGAL